MNFGLTEVLVAVLAAALLFFAYVGIVQLWREERAGLLVVLLGLCLLGVGILAFAARGRGEVRGLAENRAAPGAATRRRPEAL